jgi:hypothetical protein
MTNNELIVKLSERVEDVTFQDFSIDECVSALNSAKDVVVESINPSYLDGFETTELDGIEVSGDYTLSDTFTRGVRNDTFRVRYIKDSNEVRIKNSDFIPILPLNSMDGINNSYLVGDVDNPVAYIFGNTLSIRPLLPEGYDWTSLELFGYDILRISKVLDGTDLDMTDTTDIGLGGMVSGIVLDIAESNLWKSDNKLNRSNLAYTRGMELVQTFNGQA